MTSPRRIRYLHGLAIASILNSATSGQPRSYFALERDPPIFRAPRLAICVDQLLSVSPSAPSTPLRLGTPQPGTFFFGQSVLPATLCRRGRSCGVPIARHHHYHRCRKLIGSATGYQNAFPRIRRTAMQLWPLRRDRHLYSAANARSTAWCSQFEI